MNNSINPFTFALGDNSVSNSDSIADIVPESFPIIINKDSPFSSDYWDAHKPNLNLSFSEPNVQPLDFNAMLLNFKNNCTDSPVETTPSPQISDQITPSTESAPSTENTPSLQVSNHSADSEPKIPKSPFAVQYVAPGYENSEKNKSENVVASQPLNESHTISKLNDTAENVSDFSSEQPIFKSANPIDLRKRIDLTKHPKPIQSTKLEPANSMPLSELSTSSLPLLPRQFPIPTPPPSSMNALGALQQQLAANFNNHQQSVNLFHLLCENIQNYENQISFQQKQIQDLSAYCDYKRATYNAIESEIKFKINISQQLEYQIQSLHTANQQKQQEIESQSNMLRSLELQANLKGFERTELSNSLLTLQSQIELIENSIEALRNSIPGKREKEKMLREEMQSFIPIDEDISSQIQELQKEIDEKNNQKQEISSKIEELNTSIKTIELEKKRLSEELNYLKNLFSGINADTKEILSKIDQLKNEIQLADQKKLSLEKDIVEHTNLIKQYSETNAQLMKTNQNLINEAKNLSKIRVKLEKKEASLKRTSNELMTKKTKIENKISLLKNQIAETETCLSNIKESEDLENELAKLNSRLCKLLADGQRDVPTNEAMQKLKEEKNNIENQINEAKALKEDIKNANNELYILNKKKKDNQKVHKNLLKKIKALNEGSETDLNNKIYELRQQFDKLNAEQNGKEAICSNISLLIKELDRVKNFGQMTSKLEERCSSLIEKIKEKVPELERNHEEKNALKKELAELKESDISSKHTIQVLTADCKQLDEALGSEINKNKILEENNVSLEKDNKSLKEQNLLLLQRIDELMKQHSPQMSELMKQQSSQMSSGFRAGMSFADMLKQKPIKKK